MFQNVKAKWACNLFSVSYHPIIYSIYRLTHDIILQLLCATDNINRLV